MCLFLILIKTDDVQFSSKWKWFVHTLAHQHNHFYRLQPAITTPVFLLYNLTRLQASFYYQKAKQVYWLVSTNNYFKHLTTSIRLTREVLFSYLLSPMMEGSNQGLDLISLSIHLSMAHNNRDKSFRISVEGLCLSNWTVPVLTVNI